VIALGFEFQHDDDGKYDVVFFEARHRLRISEKYRRIEYVNALAHGSHRPPPET
jgi:hypothetical protein